MKPDRTVRQGRIGDCRTGPHDGPSYLRFSRSRRRSEGGRRVAEFIPSGMSICKSKVSVRTLRTSVRLSGRRGRRDCNASRPRITWLPHRLPDRRAPPLPCAHKIPFRRREAVGRAPGWTRATARVAVSWVVGAWSAHEDPGRSQGGRTAARRHWRQLPSLLREPCGVDRYRAWLRPNMAGVKMGERGGLGIHVRA
jgi:hypothetical protein